MVERINIHTYVQACCPWTVSLQISLDDYYEIQNTTFLEDFSLVSVSCSMATGEHPPICRRDTHVVEILLS